jgi:hypothetical protein
VADANTVVKVFDLTGRLLQTVQTNTITGINNLTVNMAEFAAGIYTVQLFENGQLTNASQVCKTINSRSELFI